MAITEGRSRLCRDQSGPPGTDITCRVYLATLRCRRAVRFGIVGAGAAGWGILPFLLLILLGNLLLGWRGGTSAGENLLAPVRVPEARDATTR
jgi:hypothetical protein